MRIHKGKTLILAISLIFVGSLSQAQVYKWTDASGRVHFSDKKPEIFAAEEVKVEINTYTQVTFEKSIYDVGPEVVMYATDWCGYCKKARQRYKKMDATGVSVILVGDRRMNGFSEQRFDSLYK